MKKLITSALIIMTLIFGIISCSGNLHDGQGSINVQGLNGWQTSLWIDADGNGAEFTSTATSHDLAIMSDGDWGGKGGVVIRGAAILPGTLPEGVSIADNTGPSYGPSGQNVKLNGTKENQKYRIEFSIRDDYTAYVSLYEL